MHHASTQKMRNEVISLLRDQHGLDNFELREFLGMLFCQAVVADVRRKEIVNPDDYLLTFAEMVRTNLDKAKGRSA